MAASHVVMEILNRLAVTTEGVALSAADLEWGKTTLRAAESPRAAAVELVMVAVRLDQGGAARGRRQMLELAVAAAGQEAVEEAYRTALESLSARQSTKPATPSPIDGLAPPTAKRTGVTRKKR